MKMDQEVFEAFERYQKSSVGCRTEDLLDMGRIYENGCVLKEDCKAAFECYKHAAESEDPEALMELGERQGEVPDPYLAIYELFDKKTQFGN